MNTHDDYWAGAQNTFVAHDYYYQRVGEALQRLLLPRLSQSCDVLDVGCGDGFFTSQVAPHVASVEAYDISPSLIAQAERRGLDNTAFRVGDVLKSAPRPYDVVLCMGVLVCITSDDDFEASLVRLCQSVRPGGLLVLRETVVPIIARQGSDDYDARYRTQRAYRRLLRRERMAPVAAERLALWSKLTRRQNWLWILENRR